MKRFKTRAEYLRWYRQENLEKTREYERNYARQWRKDNPEKQKAKDKRTKARHKEKIKEYSREYAKTYRPDPIKLAARTLLNNAVSLGKLMRPDQCERCDTSGKIQGHHHDYNKPLDVNWLCQECHTLEHKQSKTNKTTYKP